MYRDMLISPIPPDLSSFTREGLESPGELRHQAGAADQAPPIRLRRQGRVDGLGSMCRLPNSGQEQDN